MSGAGPVSNGDCKAVESGYLSTHSMGVYGGFIHFFTQCNILFPLVFVVDAGTCAVRTLVKKH